MSNLKYESIEVTNGMLNQSGIFMAHLYDHVSEPDEVHIYVPQEGYIFKNIKNVSINSLNNPINTYVQAKTIEPGDDLTLISSGTWNPSSLTNGHWIDAKAGMEVFGSFTHVALLKPGQVGGRMAFALTMMERRV